MHVDSSRKAKQKHKEKNEKKNGKQKKGNLFLNRSQVWRASKTARGCKKMFPVTRQEKIEGEAAWKKCMANGSGKMKKKSIAKRGK